MKPIYPMTLLYDGACVICRNEVAMLRRRDRHGRLRFVDIAAPGFDARAWAAQAGVPALPGAAELDARIHAVTAGREILVGLDVLRHAWRAAGLGWIAGPLGWRALRPFAERAYLLFARHRHALSRRLARLWGREAGACASGACGINRKGN